MSITEIRIVNLHATNQLSLDIELEEGRNIRDKVPANGYVNVAGRATTAELNRNPTVLAMRGISPVGTPKIRIDVVAPLGVSDDLPPMKALALTRLATPADSTLTADVIGATTETAHTALSIPAALLNQARRVIRFRGRFHVIAANGADTWTFRIRLGGLTGVLLVASAAINITTGDVYEVSGTIEVRTLGATGTFDGVAEFLDIVNDTGDVDTATLAQLLNTTAAVSLVATGECSTNNAGNQVSLRQFACEVLAA